MKKRKTNVDREYLSSEYIQSKQDFGTVLNQVKLLQKPAWKSAWFYGPVGLAVVAVVASASTFNPTQMPSHETGNSTAKPNHHINPQSVENEVLPISKERIINEEKENASLGSRDQLEAKKLPVSEHRSVDTDQKKEVIQRALEEPEVVPEPIRKKSKFPHVNHVFTGEIPIEDLRHYPIESDAVERITEFTIHYAASNGDETIKVKGNRIPEDICTSIQKNGIGYMLFITEIKGINDLGELISLASINIIPVK